MDTNNKIKQNLTIFSYLALLVCMLFPFLLYGLSCNIYPIEDAYVRGGEYGDQNFGNEDDLCVKKGTVEDYFRRSYLKFDLQYKKNAHLHHFL